MKTIDVSGAALDAVLVVDTQGRIVRANEVAEAMFGYSHDELLSQSVEKLMPVRRRSATTKRRKNQFGSRRAWASGLLRHPVVVTKDGRTLSVDVRVHWITEDDAKYAVVTVRDTTSHGYLQELLSATEARLRSMVSLSSDWYWQSDAEHRFTSIYGEHPQTPINGLHNVLGKTRFELDYEWESDDIREAHRQALAEHTPFRNLLIHNPENDRYAMTSGEPLFDHQGTFIGYQGVSRDVTNEKRSERALRESEARFRALTALSADWYWEQDADLRFTFISGIDDETHLNTIEDVIGKTRLELPYDWESPEIRAEHERILAERKPFRNLLLHNRTNDRYALINGEPVFTEDGRFRGYQGVSIDITAEKRSERALRESEARFRALTAMSSDWYWEQDEQFRFVYFSPTADNNARIEIGSILGRTRFELPVVWESEAAKQRHRETLEGCLPFRDLLLRTEPADQYVLVSGEPIFDEQGHLKGYRGIARDVTAQKKAEARALQLATRDPLTNLPNRALLIDRIEHAIKRNRSKVNCVAVLFIDLDRFKTLNESLGHGGGDELLRHVADRLGKALGATDSLCRFGGDEFVAVLEDVANVAEIEIIANEVLAAVMEPVDIQGLPFHTSASIGISLYPDDSERVEVLLRNADLAMYEAKAKGGGRFRFYDDRMNEKVAQRVQFDRELRQAIRNQEFDTYLQPQYDIASGNIIGAEVLLRWRHPVHGLVLPDKFIQLAEDSGLIVQIGYQVLERTFDMIADWLRLGVEPPRIAVNISSRQLLDGEPLLSRVKTLIEQTGVPPELVEFEITESLLIPNEDTGTRAVLEAFGDLGIRLAIDDFGTGYSSLRYLKHLPVGAVKVDRSFVADIDNNEDSMAIVRAVIGIAQSMKLEVISEGVELESQLAVLRQAGCDTYQGFLGARPMARCLFENQVLGISGLRSSRCHPSCDCDLSLQATT